MKSNSGILFYATITGACISEEDVGGVRKKKEGRRRRIRNEKDGKIEEKIFLGSVSLHYRN